MPLLYTNVALRNWKSFEKVGANSIYAPGMYHSSVNLDLPVAHLDLQFPLLPPLGCWPPWVSQFQLLDHMTRLRIGHGLLYRELLLICSLEH